MSGFDKSLRMRWLIERGWTEAPYDERLGPYRLLPPSWLVIPGKTFYVYDAQDIHERVMDEYFADEARDRKEADGEADTRG